VVKNKMKVVPKSFARTRIEQSASVESMPVEHTDPTLGSLADAQYKASKKPRTSNSVAPSNVDQVGQKATRPAPSRTAVVVSTLLLATIIGLLVGLAIAGDTVEVLASTAAALNLAALLSLLHLRARRGGFRQKKPASQAVHAVLDGLVLCLLLAVVLWLLVRVLLGS
jgi:hypothetical protein